ncbi:NUDIX domain-containing protein [Ectopseudomonas khazarica]|uniref:NUDIX domain-containing protein n=1 Tax=Ectopseudomonas khazarica TaxID=2502979 RepID=A0ABW7MIV3_9GAMM
MFPVSIKGVLFTQAQECVLALNDRDEWELPGGRIEVGESPEFCLAREFQEELSIDINVECLLDTYLFEVIPERHVFIVTYGCSLAGVFLPTVSEEHKDIRVFSVSALPANLPPGYRRSIETWYARI